MKYDERKKKYGIASLILILILIAFLVGGSKVSTGTSVPIPKDEYPLYGSAEQDTLNGWVQVVAEDLTFITNTQTTTTTKVRGVGTNTMTEVYALYMIHDSEGRELLFRTRESSTAQLFASSRRYTEADLPLHLYGSLEKKNVGAFYADYTGMGSMIREYREDNLLTVYGQAAYSWQYSAGATRWVPDEQGEMIRNICTAGAILSVIGLVVVRILARKSRIRESEALPEEQMI